MLGRQNKKVNIDITGSKLYLDLTNFMGDEQEALTFVQDFCKNHEVRSESYGHGYGALIIDNKTHGITPYGIDLNMMIEFCGGKVSDFQQQKSSVTAAIAVAGGSPIMSTPKAQPVSVSEFLAAAADGDIKVVGQYLKQNPEGKPDGDYENPLSVAKQLASLRESKNAYQVLNMLEIPDLKGHSPGGM